MFFNALDEFYCISLDTPHVPRGSTRWTLGALMDVTYEVYTLAGGRWMLDTRFAKDERQRAIYEGQLLHKSGGFEAVKVVRESFGDSRVMEKVVYNSQSSALDGSADVATPDAGRANALSFDDDDMFGSAATVEVAAPVRRRGAATRVASSPAFSPMALLLTKVVLITLASFVFAGLTTMAYGVSGI